jgi:hypothetical protein
LKKPAAVLKSRGAFSPDRGEAALMGKSTTPR